MKRDLGEIKQSMKNEEKKGAWPLLQLKYVSLSPTHSLDIDGLFIPAHSLYDCFSTLVNAYDNQVIGQVKQFMQVFLCIS